MLKQLFKSLAVLKSDIFESDSKCIVCNENSFSNQNVRYVYDLVKKTISRILDGKKELILSNVTKFSMKFLEESNSVIYRIELNNKEEVRGYVYITR